MMKGDTVDDEAEDVCDGLGGDEGGRLVLGRGDGRENSIQMAGDGHILRREDSKIVHTLGRGEDVEQVAPQAVEVHKVLIGRDDWARDHNRLCTIYQAHVLCTKKTSVETGHTS